MRQRDVRRPARRVATAYVIRPHVGPGYSGARVIREYTPKCDAEIVTVGEARRGLRVHAEWREQHDET